MDSRSIKDPSCGSCGPFLYQAGVWRCRHCGRARVSADAFRRDPDALTRAGDEGVMVTDDNGSVVGVVSCPTESPELAAIRRRLDERTPEGYEDTLLRTVEDLTKENAEWRSAVCDRPDGWMHQVGDLRKERDDLRAKLAEAEATAQCRKDDGDTARLLLKDMAARLDEVNGKYEAAVPVAAKAMARAEAAEKKLAEAERRDDELCKVISILKSEEADDASRIRELEAKLAQSEEWGKLLNERWTAEVEHARMLQDKLSEAEKLIANAHDVMVDQKKRADAVEARCRELERELAEERRTVDMTGRGLR